MRMRPINSTVVLGALFALLAGGCGGSAGADAEWGTGGANLGASPGIAKDGRGVEDGGSGGNDHVSVCHIPPGNPANAHTIIVGAPAVEAHLRHGDTLGACGGDAGTPTDGGSSEVDAGSGGAEDGGSACLPQGAECDSQGGSTCCDGMTCSAGQCSPVIG
ncbi:hypothetical protein DRW03_19520 [Corallococcus sp. H22C18031201]|nr:hypothetical protein DRW03_19520 [Corallococcus sp. H22C18031201]